MSQTAIVNIKIDGKDASNTVGNLNNQLTETNKSTGSLRSELKRTIDELQKLEPNSAAFQQLSLRAAELRNQISDTNTIVNQLSGNLSERLFKGIGGVVQVGVAGFQAMSAAQALFGEQSEDLQKTMVKLQAVLNLSQAISSFSGFGKQITAIRALMTSLTVSTTTQTVAQTGLNTATVGGTIATRALGLAMKSLPIFALIAGVTALVLALSNYTSKSKEAAEQEKKRREEAQALAEAAEKERKELANTSGAFLLLIERLKQTNSESTERRDLLKEINKEYGTNLKNIEDETEFLKNLEDVAEKYIKFQRLKFALQKNQEQFNELLAEEFELNEKLVQAQKFAEIEISKRLNEAYPSGQLLDAVKIVSNLNSEKEKLQKRMVELTKDSAKYSKEQSDLNTTLKEGANLQTENAKKEKERLETLRKLQEAQRNYNNILKEIENLAKTAFQSETQLFQQRQQRGEETIDLVERERDVRLESVEKVYLETKRRIETEIRDRQSRDIALRNLEINYSNFLRFENLQRLERERFLQSEIVKLNQKTLFDLQTQRLRLNQEGLKLVLESQIIENKINKDRIDNQLKNEQLGLSQFKKLQEERLKLTQKQLKQEKELSLRIAKNKYEETIESEINNQIQTQNLREKYNIITIKNESGKWDTILTINEEYQKKLNELGQEAIDEAKDIRKKTELNLNEFSAVEYIKLVNKKTEINQEYDNGLINSSADTNRQIYDQTIETYTRMGDAVASNFQKLSDIISEVQSRTRQQITQQLQDTIDSDRERINSNLAAELISKEQYDNEVEQLEQKRRQKELQIQRDAFRKKQRLDVVAATIDGARAVLSAYAQTPGEVIIKSIAAAIAGVFAKVQIGLIASQKFTAVKGGIVPGDGSGQVDSVDAKLAPGEAVINSRSTRDFLPLLSAINEANGGNSFVPDLPPSNASQKFAPVFTETLKQEQILRAYVVESDITDAQRRINRIEKSITF